MDRATLIDAASLAPIHAPVLQLPRLFDRSLCQRLIESHARGSIQGTVMLVKAGHHAPGVDKTVKNRRDHWLVGSLQQEVWRLLCARAWPAVSAAFACDISRFEYLVVGCYSDDEQGQFLPHRDNASPLTAHRRFALSLNLNADYEGGEIYFPEFQSDAYRPAAGDGVVFSCSLVHAAAPVTRGKRYVLVGMLGSDADLAVFKAARQIRRPARAQQLAQDARALRHIAGDAIALGERVEPRLAARLDQLHVNLAGLERDLRAARPAGIEAWRPGGGELKLHLGCGDQHFAGWINIDARGGDVRRDLRWPLPFADASVRYVYACHVVEHLYRASELPRLLSEIRRVLAAGGVLRVVVPDIEQCLRAYVAGDERFFADRAKTWPWAAAHKTRLDHFLAYAGAGHEDLDGHKYGYDFETLANVLREAGFSHVEGSAFMASAHADLRVDNRSPNANAHTDGRHYSLFVEAS
jgi:predicted SAM-dependent methyltransferase/predicted 2-oxoglutarate/Fe(II)-dependent dioxygenase YbiX